MRSKFNRFFALMLAFALAFGGFAGFGKTTAANAADSVKVYVTIADEIGLKVVKQQSVTVTDINDDGVLTYIDALYCAHEKYFKGGAAAGFAYSIGTTMDGDPLPWVTLLWGIDIGGSYGFYKNNASIASVADGMIENGDYIDAYVYRDLESWSDTYSNFAKRRVVAAKNKAVKLKVYYMDRDENWMETPAPLANANIRINNKETDYVTDENGIVKVKFDKAGSYMVTATNSYKLIVDPICLVFVRPDIGEVITVKNINYTVTKAGKPDGKKGVVTYSAELNPKNTKDVPKTVDFGGITYKVKKVK
ncbi:MAG: hypothetical protein K6G81_08545 [Lachnospiraceae bacterium]|nr:hypothetical protein [Lachnospiraceae bacterium]